jgi:hypothetical protein
MGLKTSIRVFSEATTTDATTWVTVAEYPIVSDCSFEIDAITLIGRTTNGTVGQFAYCKAIHRGKRVSSNISLVGAPVYLVTFATGSESGLTSCVMQIVVDGSFPTHPRIYNSNALRLSMAVRIRFRKFYECDTEVERSLDFGIDSLIYCLDTLKYYKISGTGYVEVSEDDVIFNSPIPISKLQISGIPDGTKYLKDDGSWDTPPGGGGGGSGTPGGSNTQVQFNNSGAFGGDADLTYNNSSKVLTSKFISTESIDFAQIPSSVNTERRLQWDNDEGSLVTTLRGGNITVPLGQEIATLVYNAEATTLNKGEVVYAFGASGQRISVKRARNLSDSTSAQTLGVVGESIASGAEGFVIGQGMVRGINTSTYTQGNGLYLSSTYGQFTNVKQSAPNHLVYIGFVVKVHLTAGEIFVKCQNGYELDEIHDVQITSIADKNLIMYESSTGLWKNNISLSTDTTLSASSDSLIASQKAVKTYTDAKFATRFSRRHDYTGGYSYCGTAAFGSAESAAAWYITRIPINANGTVGTVQRSANNSIWNNRTSLTYT